MSDSAAPVTHKRSTQKGDLTCSALATKSSSPAILPLYPSIWPSLLIFSFVALLRGRQVFLTLEKTVIP
ncbi:hypothetical protein ATANTOWER_020234 [Ataeniobius toweri]|uniref:Uncharacterized protein n=1 Tax=Ataeniobius toweri TaxID=208326 RepID=A0ABU7AQ66_9TELE|nr:hypothetical protein [Ataeniobius toweri]